MRLSEWLSTNKVTQAQFADTLDVTQGRVAQVVKGGTNSLKLALKIKEATGGGVQLKDLLQQEPA